MLFSPTNTRGSPCAGPHSYIALNCYSKNVSYSFVTYELCLCVNIYEKEVHCNLLQNKWVYDQDAKMETLLRMRMTICNYK